MQAEIRWALTAQSNGVFSGAVYGSPLIAKAASIGPATTRTQPTPAALRAEPPEQRWIGIVKPPAALDLCPQLADSGCMAISGGLEVASASLAARWQR